MSGGHFDYKQYELNQLADEVDQLILDNSEKDWMNYSDETIKEFKKASWLLRLAATYTQRIDWLVSGDDGEESFHKRLGEDLGRLYDTVHISKSD